MPTKKYIVELTTEERSRLETMARQDRISAYKRRHAEMLLAVDQGPDGPAMKDSDVAAAFRCRVKTLERIRRRCVEDGLDAVLRHGNRGRYRATAFDGEAEARVIALACGKPPAGRNRWTLELLAEKAVALRITESCSKSSVHRLLQKTSLSLT